MSPPAWLKPAVVLALVLLVAIALARYRHLESEAGLVPQLEARIANDEKQAAALATRLAAIDAARNAADGALNRFEADKSKVLANLNQESRHAATETNPLCTPSPDDRRLRNATLARLLAGS